ncbi:MAG: 4-alpha-glucanotransferase, partial [Spirochaetota bacterium]
MQMHTRSAGILLHPVSLPSEDGIGDFGRDAFRFIDFLIESEIGIWQVLPLGPTAFGNSPYTAVSSFAGNPLLLSLDALRAEGWLKQEDLAGRPDFSPDFVDYEAVHAWKDPLLRKAAAEFLKDVSGAGSSACGDFEEFCAKEEWWLEDYALFVTAKHCFDAQAREEGAEDARWNYYWPEALANREPGELQRWSEEWQQEIAVEKALQFFFLQQWQ